MKTWTFLLLLTFGSLYSESEAIFAGGCFWCMQEAFDELSPQGVISTEVGFTGGTKENPSYKEVSSGKTGHFEALLVTYDPSQISYNALLKHFWKQVDPTDGGGQFCDRGQQYSSAIFFGSDEEKTLAEESKEKLLEQGAVPVIKTAILPKSTFYPAEESHQKYYQKHPYLYQFYKFNCGRKKRLKEIWES